MEETKETFVALVATEAADEAAEDANDKSIVVKKNESETSGDENNINTVLETDVKSFIPIECSFCPLTFPTFAHLDGHIDSAHVLKSEHCWKCGKAFREKVELTVHFLLLHDDNVKDGEKCELRELIVNGKPLSDAALIWWKHLIARGESVFSRRKKASAALQSSSDATDDDVKRWQQMAEKSARKQRRLLRKRKQKSYLGPKGDFLCSLCGKKYERKRLLQQHVRGMHKPDNAPPVLHSCTECSRKYERRDSLRRHYKDLHNEGRKVVCQYCGKAYGSNQNMRHHVAYKHEGAEKRQKCDRCDAAFITRGYLKHHAEAVHDGKEDACKLCDRTFISKNYLESHMYRVHQVENSAAKVRRHQHTRHCGTTCGY